MKFRKKIMIQKREINGVEWMPPSDLYEWAIEELSKGTFKGFAEEKVLENLKGVEWIQEKFKSLNGLELVKMYYAILEGINDGSMPPDPMSVSAMYYNFTLKGLKTEDMRNAINSSPYLLEEIEKMIRGEIG